MTTTIYDDKDEELTVHATYTPGLKGERDEYGVPLEPDDEPEIEVSDVGWTEDGEECELTEEQRERATDQFWDEIL